MLIQMLDYIRFRRSYSQDGEDVVLLSFYENIKKYRGFYVDIGAHHPVRFSNTLLFYKRGWRGVNIDPTPGSMRSFKLLRSKDINLEIGIGEKSGKMTFYCFNEPAINTFDQTLAAERAAMPRYTIVKEIEVLVEPLAVLLNRVVPDGRQIDFFTIDVEGLDLQVLKSNDWGRFSPNYILVEDIGFDFLNYNESEMYQYLYEKGYKIISILKRTIIYQKR